MTHLQTSVNAPRAIMWACAGKQAFTFERAKQVSRKMRRAGREGGIAGAYHCRHCGAWHVGHGAK